MYCIETQEIEFVACEQMEVSVVADKPLTEKSSTKSSLCCHCRHLYTLIFFNLQICFANLNLYKKRHTELRACILFLLEFVPYVLCFHVYLYFENATALLQVMLRLHVHIIKVHPKL